MVRNSEYSGLTVMECWPETNVPFNTWTETVVAAATSAKAQL